MKKRTKFIMGAISLYIFLIFIFAMFGSEEDIPKFLGLSLASLFPLFLILNSMRYIDYRKWYIDPTSYGWPFVLDGPVIDTAWYHLVVGAILLIVVIFSILLLIFG